MDTKMTILYIDDEPTNLMLFASMFKYNFNVITGISGFEGLEKLKQFPEIQIIFSDMKMPGMNGIEFISLAKKEYGDKIYFLITGYNITQEIADALENKIIAKYFSKPFNIREIESSISEILRNC
jgi:response regulator RpfG family c-di-GMP phosphodiesterase